MAYVVVSKPDRYIPGTPVVSRWVATDCPVIFGVQRIDGTIVEITSQGGFARLSVNNALPNFQLELTEPVLLIALTDPTNYIYANVSQVISPGVYLLDVPYMDAMAYSTHIVAYARNINYLYECKLTLSTSSSPVYFTATPSPRGYAELQVNRYLYDQVSDDKAASYEQALIAESGQSGKFELAIREVYAGANNLYVPLADSYYFVKAARDKEDGVNMFEFVPNFTEPSRFMNLFGEPTISRGLPFDASFIYPEELGDDVQVVETRLDASGLVLSTKTSAAALVDRLKGKLVSYWVDTSDIPTNCTAIRLELQGNEPIPVNIWYITVLPFSVENPLKFTKNTGANTVTVEGKLGDKRGAIPAIPNVAVYPAAVENIDANFLLSMADLYVAPARRDYELGISDIEFAKFTRACTFNATVIVQGFTANGSAVLDPAAITTKVQLMAAIKSAFDTCVTAINSHLSTTYLATMNSDQETMARSRIYLFEDESGGYADTGFFAMIYSYEDIFTFDVYNGVATTFTFASNFNVQFPFHVGTLRPDGTTLFNSWNALGMGYINNLPTITYTALT